jgi:DNA-binding transcriptional MerR regulator
MEDASPGEEALSIQTVSERLGVPAPTLRSWERRYGVPDTPRSPGGHRRYSAEALNQLRRMR